MKKIITLLSSTALIGALVACGNTSNYQQENVSADTTTRTISVTGLGTATEVPDLVSFTFSVENQGDIMEEVQAENAESTNSIVELLKESGVSSDDIQTSDYYMSERWDYEKNEYDGYTASQTITVSRQDADTAGSLISLVGSQVDVSDIQGPIFEISNSDEAYKDALLDAVEDAKEKASAIAESNGLQVVQIISITENSSSSYPITYYDASARMSKASVEDVSLETGTTDISAEVYVVFEVEG